MNSYLSVISENLNEYGKYHLEVIEMVEEESDCLIYEMNSDCPVVLIEEAKRFAKVNEMPNKIIFE